MTKEVNLNWDLARTTTAQRHSQRGHVHPPANVMSRRGFARTAAGAAAGALLGAGMMPPLARAEEKGSSSPLPIPVGTPFLGGGFHVFGPAAFDPIDAQPATITDFNGFVGLAYLSGTVNETNRHTGTVRTLPFVDSDMRFMSGVYRGVDNRIHQGAFALV
jgi:hypothetical protein